MENGSGGFMVVEWYLNWVDHGTTHWTTLLEAVSGQKMMKCCFKLVDRIPATLEKKTASRMSDNGCHCCHCSCWDGKNDGTNHPNFLRNVAINQGSVDITSQKCLIDWQISYEAEISTGIPKSGKELLLITCRVSKDIKKLAATSSSN